MSSAGDAQAQILEDFRRLGISRNGTVSKSELSTVLQFLDPKHWTDESVGTLFKAIDTNADDRIDLSEFTAWAFQQEAGALLQAEDRERLQATSQRELAARLQEKRQAEEEEDYRTVQVFVQQLRSIAPRSMPPEKTEAAAKALLAAAGVEDTTEAQRGKGVHKSYLQIMAGIARKIGQVEDLVGLLSEHMVDFEKQDAARRGLAESFSASGVTDGVRWREMMIGSAIGDAFGAGLEFYDGPYIKEKVDGSKWVTERGDPVLDFHYQGPLVKDHYGVGHNYQPGMYTDDCEMTVGLMHALMHDNRTGKLSKDDMIHWWKTEYDKGTGHYLLARIWSLVGVGRNGHGGISTIYNSPVDKWPQLLEAQRRRLARSKCPGNAPPMRALGLAFLPDDLMLQYSIANAESTHPHPKATTATLCIVYAARKFVCDRAPTATIITDVISSLSKLDSGDPAVPDEETMQYLAQVDSLPAPQPVDCDPPWLSAAALETLCGPQPIWKTSEEGGRRPRRVTGLDADAMRTAGCVLWVLKHHVAGRCLDTLLWSMYIGGDVDSAAQLCLAMVGGREGLAFGEPGGLPMHMIEMVEGAEYMIEIADKFASWVSG
mmetsp:Transcript_62816/g.119395  ORF Transcript_62816/g.119395 Transcript_62816/m.119395 type:complete len:602 (-) Transcript_62816:28-1833(-)